MYNSEKLHSFSILFILTLLIASLSSFGQNKKEYTINGIFQGLPDNSKVIIRTDKNDTLQTVTSKGNSVTFRGQLDLDGQFVFIAFDPLIYDKPTESIFLKNGDNLSISSTIGKREVNVKGSPEHNSFKSLAKYEFDQVQLLNKNEDAMRHYSSTIPVDSMNNRIITSQNQQTLDSFVAVRSKLIFTKDSTILSTATLPPYSLVTPYLLSNRINVENAPVIKKTFNLLPKVIQDSYYGKRLTKELKYLDTYINISHGKTMPNLRVADRDGRVVSILDIAKKNRFTLIDIWASWCAPCRSAIPNLKQVYDAYKDQGFQIVGISSDSNNKDWIKAIEDEDIKWEQYIELKDSPFSKMCGIEGIPAYILLDTNGKILSFDAPMSFPLNFGWPLSAKRLQKSMEHIYSNPN